jgi:mevalonate kinase
MLDSKTWHSNGKLLLTGEFLVLEGAKALAVPINKGQDLLIQQKPTTDFPVLEWRAYEKDSPWFQATFHLPELVIIKTSDKKLAIDLQRLLAELQKMSSLFLDGSRSIQAESNLEFDREFGFGSSSTLVSNLAHWANIDPFLLQRTVLGGSGYDIACARSNKPLLYQLVNNEPVIQEINLSFPFQKQLYFVYLGKKQRTSKSIEVFRQKAHYSENEISEISEISENLHGLQKMDEFEYLLDTHEKIMATVLGIKPVKQRFFNDHKGIVKSLGAWGGDFVLITRHIPEEDFKNYLKQKGFNTIYSWDELVLK